MSDKIRFIFSTRTLGEDYAFSQRNSLSVESKIREYLTKHFMESEEDVVNSLKECYEAKKDGEMLDWLRNGEDPSFDNNREMIKSWLAEDETDKTQLFNILLKSGVVSEKVKKEISCCPGATDQERLSARFSYYSLKDNPTPENYEAFAVPHLEWTANMDWINALIEENFEELDDCETLYLVLHDNDLPGYEHQPFHILTAEETRNVCLKIVDELKITEKQKPEIISLKDKTTESTDESQKPEQEQNSQTIAEDTNSNNEKICVFKGRQIKIIVFQHTWNDVMRVLKNQNLTLNEIESHLGANKAAVEEIFNPTSTKNLQDSFSSLEVDASVDVSQNVIKTDDSAFVCHKIDESRSCYVYEDNGALLTELMHEMTDIQSSKQFLELVKRLRNQTTEDEKVDMSKMHFPLIVKIYKSFFTDWEDAVGDAYKEKVRSHPNNKALKENLSRVFSFLNNSSIWIRLVDDDSVEKKTAEKEIKCFNELGLYDYPSAKEYIDYQVRIQKENHLDDKNGGHGAFVTPITYGNEVEARNLFLGIDKESNSLSCAFKMLGKPNSDNFKTLSTNLRILLVDDSIGRFKNDLPECAILEKEGELRTCNIKICKNKRCKLYTIQKLLSGEFLKQEFTEEYNKNTYWNNTVECSYYEQTLNLKECLADGKLKEKPYFKFPSNNGATQIIGVKDIESALVLLNYYKFDMLFFDFLLGSDGKGGREYSTDFFRFMQCHFEKGKDESEVNVIRKIKDELSSYKKNENDATPLNSVEIVDIFKGLQVNIKTNRGPLDRFWIMPITTFNQSFINDLLNYKVRLIDHRWNISHGADPINTPWQFLYALNHFVDLQLRGSVFTSKQLLTFLQYTGEELNDHIIKKEETNKEETVNTTVDFNEFQFFMGSEYANFMRHYGNMRLIQYDAVTKKDQGKELSNKSLFSTYVWENFYNKDEYLPLLALNRKMRNFYYTAAFMPNDHNGRKRLREAFNDLRLTIDLENLVQEDEKKDFEEAINNISKALNTLD